MADSEIMNGLYVIQGVDAESVNPQAMRDDYGNRVFLLFSNGDDAKQYVADSGLVGQCEAFGLPPRSAIEFLLSVEAAGEAAFYALDYKHEQNIQAESCAELIWRLVCMAYEEGERDSENMTCASQR